MTHVSGVSSVSFCTYMVAPPYSPIRRNTTTLNMDNKVGMTTPNTTPSFRTVLSSDRRPLLPALALLCFDTSFGSGLALVVSR